MLWTNMLLTHYAGACYIKLPAWVSSASCMRMIWPTCLSDTWPAVVNASVVGLCQCYGLSVLSCVCVCVCVCVWVWVYVLATIKSPVRLIMVRTLCICNGTIWDFGNQVYMPSLTPPDLKMLFTLVKCKQCTLQICQMSWRPNHKKVYCNSKTTVSWSSKEQS